MTLNVENVVVLADGKPYKWVHDISIKASAKEAVRTCNLSGAIFEGLWAFLPGTPVEVYANDDLVIGGEVTIFKPQGDKDNRNFSVDITSKAHLFTSNSAVHKTGFKEKATAVDFAKEYDPWEVVDTDINLPKIPTQKIVQGETGFQTLERYTRGSNATIAGWPDKAMVTNASVQRRHGGELKEFYNIKSYEGHFSNGSKHSDYIVKGQSRHGHETDQLHISETAKDGTVKGFRPKILLQEGETSKERAQKRAVHEKEKSAGHSIKCRIDTQGWRDDDGLLFSPMYYIYTHAPNLLKLTQDMIIEDLTLKQGNSGSIATLNLVDPRAYGGKQSNKTKTDQSAWGFG